SVFIRQLSGVIHTAAAEEEVTGRLAAARRSSPASRRALLLFHRPPHTAASSPVKTREVIEVERGEVDAAALPLLLARRHPRHNLS
ncbi:hypothetical protein ACXWOE_09505, partial [Streptococcus pyogenes]